MKPATRNILLTASIVAIIIAIVLLEEPAPTPRKGTGNAPELQGIAGYLNTENITINQLIGNKIILIDFWTYTCINCQRTLPYLTMWDKRYRDKGLVIIGVHTPEFEFEKKKENLQRAVEKWGIKYPVVQDNDYRTWRAYANRFWPHKYLIDADGNIVYDHIGEGAYEETEKRIQQELTKLMTRLGKEDGLLQPMEPPAEAVAVDFTRIRTPEIYFGAKFNRGNIAGFTEATPGRPHTFKMPAAIDPNTAALDGTWKIDADGAELISESGTIRLSYDAKVVNIVASGPSEITVKWDGETPGGAHGFSADENGSGSVDEETLYEVINAPSYGPHTVEITAMKGFRIYTFTFG